MTPKKASMIRSECIAGKCLPRKELKERKKRKNEKRPGGDTPSKVADKNKRRQHSQELLMESEGMFRSFVETASDLMCVTDKEGCFVYVNESMSRTFGYLKKEMIGMHITHLLPVGSVREGFKKNFRELIKNGEIALERTWITKTGEKIYGDVRSAAIYDSKGRFMGSRGVLRDTTKRKEAEKGLKEREKELDLKNKSLEELNAALHVLLKKRNDDKTDLEDKVLQNIQKLITPYLDKLKKSRLDIRQKSFVSILESNLKDIISPFSRGLSSQHLKLTPTEVQVSNLIEKGKTTKEIADVMNLSTKTIESHRKNIRKKIGIKNKKENLRTHLLNLFNG